MSTTASDVITKSHTAIIAKMPWTNLRKHDNLKDHNWWPVSENDQGNIWMALATSLREASGKITNTRIDRIWVILTIRFVLGGINVGQNPSSGLPLSPTVPFFQSTVLQIESTSRLAWKTNTKIPKRKKIRLVLLAHRPFLLGPLTKSYSLQQITDLPL